LIFEFGAVVFLQQLQKKDVMKGIKVRNVLDKDHNMAYSQVVGS
jgi:hypothetical protein